MKPIGLKNLSLQAAVFLAFSISVGCEKDKASAYPLTTCVICDQALAKEGAPIVFEYQGQEVKACSQEHRQQFESEPAKYLSKINETRFL